jgi:surface antigen
MDWMDFVLKFSGELLVMVLSLAVAGLNLFYFGYDAKQFQDQSLAGNFLGRHTELNPKLYAKNNTIVTLVSKNSFLPQAQADDFAGLDIQSLAAASADDGSQIVMSDEDTILAPNPDSVHANIENQVKTYTVKNGDTLGGIAGSFGISIDTIIWNNNLGGGYANPGQELKILPVDGILVTATANDTLPDIAAKYNPQRYNTDKKVKEAAQNSLLEKIISYNGLESAEDIDGGQLIIVPGGAITSAPAPAPRPTPRPTTPSTPSTKPAPLPKGASDTVTSISSGYDDDSHTFPKGYCTWYVATKMKITFGGNAKNWLANARASGYVVKGPSEPAVRTAVVTTDSARYGHVAYVIDVTDTAILVTEMNYEKFNKVNERWIPRNSKTIRGYIYP